MLSGPYSTGGHYDAVATKTLSGKPIAINVAGTPASKAYSTPAVRTNPSLATVPAANIVKSNQKATSQTGYDWITQWSSLLAAGIAAPAFWDTPLRDKEMKKAITGGVNTIPSMVPDAAKVIAKDTKDAVGSVVDAAGKAFDWFGDMGKILLVVGLGIVGLVAYGALKK